MTKSSGKRANVTPALVRRRLAALETGARGPWPPSAAGATPAAVLVPLVSHAGAMTVIFTRRARHLADHAGQISFPGGRVEPGDRDPAATALREAEEEIGLAADRVEVLGCLGYFDTTTGFSVAPVGGLVAPPLALTRDAFEVAEVFEVPLSFLLDPKNRRRELRRRRGRTREVWVFDYRGHSIWGATARMVVELCEVLDGR